MVRFITNVAEITENNYGLSEVKIQVEEIISLLKNTYFTASIVREQIQSNIAKAREEIESNIAVAHKGIKSEIDNINNNLSIIVGFINNPGKSSSSKLKIYTTSEINTMNKSQSHLSKDNDYPVTSVVNPDTSDVNRVPDTLNNEGGAKIRSYKRKTSRRRRRR
jgi:hypothetical protein